MKKKKKKYNKAKIEKCFDVNGNIIFSVKAYNVDTMDWLTVVTCKDIDVAECWAYGIAYSVFYNVD